MRRLIIYTFILSFLFCLVQAAGAAEPKVVWSKEIKHSLFEAAADGTFYVADGRKVSCYSSDGSFKWAYTLATTVRDMGTNKDGSVIVVAGKTLTRISKDGRVQWISEAEDEIVTVEVLASGMIIVGHAYGVQAFEPTGAALWDHYPHEECDF